jgi:flagellar motor switch protein FliN/FliY
VDDWSEALAEQQAAEKGEQAAESSKSQTYPRAEFDGLEGSGGGAQTSGGEVRNMDLVLDIPVTISMEIGRGRIPIRNLLQLSQGSVVELDRLAGEPLDVLVNGTLIAQGEVVVVNDKYGIRLTDVISPAERIKRLRG